MSVFITSFYKFEDKTSPLLSENQVSHRAAEISEFGQSRDFKGLVLLGEEGFNLTVSSSKEKDLDEFVQLFKRWGYQEILEKRSVAKKHPFKHFRVQIRNEIVTLGVENIEVPSHKSFHLSPEDWQLRMQEENTILLDTRNWYETKVGKFKNAVELNLEEFREFPEALKSSGLPKDKNYLIYCTGGIRCEKAIVEMQKQGFGSVHQLEGGILKYIENFPQQNFEGECFVFDHRVAVDQTLQPTETFRLCPHCGQPGDNKINCLRCDHLAIICSKCEKNEYYKTCSKHCAYQYRIRPGKKGSHQEESTYYDTRSSQNS